MKFDVVAIGDAFQDQYVFSNDFKVISDRSFKSGKSLSFDYGAKNDIERLEYHTGGSAINCSITFARLGLSSAIVSFLGSDSAADRIKSQLSAESVAFLGKITDQETNTSIILSSDGDRTILSYHGNYDYENLPLNKNLASNWFYIAPLGKDFDKLSDKIVEIIAKKSSGLIWNPGPSQIKQGVKSYKHILRLTNIIFLNREEILSFVNTGGSKVEDAMIELNRLGVKIVVTTLGKDGAIVYDGKLFYKIDASTDKRVDATGAGDAFASTFSAKIIKKYSGTKSQSVVPIKDDIVEALVWAVVNSGSVVGKIGANEGILKTVEIELKASNLARLEANIYTL